MSEKKARLVVFCDAAAWIEVDADRKNLRIGYTRRGTDNFAIEKYDIAIVESHNTDPDDIADLLDIPLLLPVHGKKNSFGLGVKPE